jgi:hypothetical protein
MFTQDLLNRDGRIVYRLLLTRVLILVPKWNRWGFPTAWYLLLGYCWTKSPVGFILMPEEKGRFKRIGCWQSKEPNQPPLTFNERFSREERRQIVIV